MTAFIATLGVVGVLATYLLIGQGASDRRFKRLVQRIDGATQAEVEVMIDDARN